MASLSPNTVREVTQAYETAYLDKDRVTPEELAALKQNRTRQECALIDGLHQAVVSDDYLSDADILAMPALPDHFRTEFKKEFARDFGYAWLNGFATQIAAKPNGKSLPFEERKAIATKMEELDATLLTPKAQKFVVSYSLLIAYEEFGPALFDSIRASATTLVTMTQEYAEMKKAIQEVFGEDANDAEVFRIIDEEVLAAKTEVAESLKTTDQLEKKFSRNMQKAWNRAPKRVPRS